MRKAWDDFKQVRHVAVGEHDGKPCLVTMGPAGYVFRWQSVDGYNMVPLMLQELANVLNEGLALGEGLGPDGWHVEGVVVGSQAQKDQDLIHMPAQGAVC